MKPRVITGIEELRRILKDEELKQEILHKQYAKELVEERGLQGAIQAVVNQENPKFSNNLYRLTFIANELNQQQLNHWADDQLNWDIDCGRVLIDDEGLTAFYSWTHRAIKLRLYELYQAGDLKRYKALESATYGQFNAIGFLENRAYGQWRYKYSHLWTDEGLRYYDLCEQEGYLVYMKLPTEFYTPLIKY